MGPLRLVWGRSNSKLAEDIANVLRKKSINAKLDNCTYISDFADGEIRLKMKESLRGNDVFILQPTQPPANNFIELLLMIDAAKRASAERVTAVVPYFGFARQDRKDEPRVPISAKLMANIVTTAGADRILTIELHSPQIQGFFDIPADHLLSDALFVESFKKDDKLWNSIEKGKFVVVSPDTGGVRRSEMFLGKLIEAKGWGEPNDPTFFQDHTAIFYKIRYAQDQSTVSDKPLGNVKDKIAIIRDDIADTGGTLKKVIEKLKSNGAKSVIACATHPILVENKASKNLNDASIKDIFKALYVTDSIPISEKNKEELKDKLLVVSTAELFAQSILKIHLNESLSPLF